MLAGLGWLQPAGAQDDAARFPSKPVRWVVPYPPGASNDVVARVLSAKVSERWGQQMLIDNRGGAGGMLGGDMVAKAAPDGYTLLMANPGSNSINFALRMKSPYRAEDFVEVILLGWSPITVVVGPSFKGASVRELVAQARANPGKFTGGSSGNGGSSHLALELFNLQAGTKIVHIAYKGGGPAIVDLLSGNINLIFATAASAVPHMQTNRIRALAVTTIKRSALVPNLPTISESGVKGFDANNWYGVLVPAKTPRPIINRLNKEVVAVLNLPDIKDILFKSGLDAAPSTPEEFGAYIKSEKDKWEKVIKAAGLYQTN